MGTADMVTIGTGRDDLRQWVKVAYMVNDAIQCGQTGLYGKLTTRSELVRTLSVHPQTVARAYKELADQEPAFPQEATFSGQFLTSCTRSSKPLSDPLVSFCPSCC
jgi:DNA-binding transcriptional regulator YhcF (GntR family)